MFGTVVYIQRDNRKTHGRIVEGKREAGLIATIPWMVRKREAVVLCIFPALQGDQDFSFLRTIIVLCELS